jgi:hypothetical protein
MLSTFLQRHSEAGSTSDEEISIDDSTEESASLREKETAKFKSVAGDDRRLQSLLMFSDVDTYQKAFPPSEPRLPPRQKVCAVTGLRANYFDPVTQLPYANLKAFRILREAYYAELEANGNRDDPKVSLVKSVQYRARELVIPSRLLLGSIGARSTSLPSWPRWRPRPPTTRPATPDVRRWRPRRYPPRPLPLPHTRISGARASSLE